MALKQVKILQGQSANLPVNPTNDAIYISLDKSILVAGGNKYYGNPTLSYEDNEGASGKSIVLYGDVDKTVQLGTIDATDFIKDSFLSAVTVSGTEVTFSWNTESGIEDTTIDFADFIDLLDSTLAMSATTLDGNGSIEIQITQVDGKLELGEISMNGILSEEEIEELIEKGVVKEAKFNDVDATITESESGSTITFVVDGNDIEIGDYNAVEYDSEFASKEGVSAVTADDAVSEAINKVEGAVKVLVDEVISADEILTSAITEVADAAGVLQTEGDKKVIKYVADDTTEYINDATSLFDADVKLDAAVKEVAEAVESAVTSIVIADDSKDILSATATPTASGVEYELSIDVPETVVYEGVSAITISEEAEEGVKQVELKLDNSEVTEENGGVELTQTDNGLVATLYWGTF